VSNLTLGRLSDQQWPQCVPGQNESALDQLDIAFERAVLMLDRNTPSYPAAIRAAMKRFQGTSPRPGMRGTCQPMPKDMTPFS